MAKKQHTEQSLSDKVMTSDEVKAFMIQHQKDAAFPSLLYVTRKLGEVEGLISMQPDPDEALVNVQSDFKRLYDKLVQDAGIELLPESGGGGIGGE